MSTSFLRPHCAHDRQPTGIAAAIYGGQGGFLWCGGHSFAGVKFRYIRLRGHQRDFIGNAMNFGLEPKPPSMCSLPTSPR
jgi:hypothetical protein